MTSVHPAASPRGTFTRVAESLSQRIETRQITGDLPSEAALGAEFGVSRTTIRRALKALAERGVIGSVPGVGWRVGGPAEQRPLVELMLAEFEGKSVGDSFPSERYLCDKYRVSRPMVRDALSRLEGTGLLVTLPGKGRQVVALPTRDERP
ncbi:MULTISPECIES: GntR family transcriptional regulator [Protofrankia]|uniref:Transcriptional regulator, GntR family n=1 Tax=Candidatus Protofrankia datiscae TaxID=2716812 RepID=F8B479_9ACTN|nr:transcriptional regulator, GntR family [Candidatus Protofrankia datiscae]